MRKGEKQRIEKVGGPGIVRPLPRVSGVGKIGRALYPHLGHSKRQRKAAERERLEENEVFGGPGLLAGPRREVSGRLLCYLKCGMVGPGSTQHRGIRDFPVLFENGNGMVRGDSAPVTHFTDEKTEAQKREEIRLKCQRLI